MGSSRLPGKHLLNFSKQYRSIDLIIRELNRNFEDDNIILCTSDLKVDNELVQYFQMEYPDIKIFRGSEANVLNRIYDCIKEHPSDDYCRLNADNIFTSSSLIKSFQIIHKEFDLDFTCNTLSRSMPKGVSIQIFKRNFFENYFKKAKGIKMCQEHVFMDIENHTKRILNIKFEIPCSNFEDNLALDTVNDLAYLKSLVNLSKFELYFKN